MGKIIFLDLVLMRVFDKIKICLFAVLLLIACSEDQEKKLASGYTEEQNAGRLDPVLAERLKTWEPEVPVDSTKRSVEVDSSTFFWYEIEFSTDAETFYECDGTDSVECSVNIYAQENGVRLNMARPAMTYVYTEYLMRDSAKAVVVDRLDNTYSGDSASTLCRRDSLEFVDKCEDNDGVLDDMLGLASCSELHLACTWKFTPTVNAGLFLKNTAAELQKKSEGKDSSEGGDDSGNSGDDSGDSGNKTAEWDSVLTDERDGQTYKTTVVNGQHWMAENLRYDAGDASACYDDDEENCATYGRLYTWDTLLCPTGWRMPTLEEYRALEELAEEDVSRLKSTTGWDPPGTDDYGLNFLPGGMCDKPSDSESDYYGMGTSLCLWTSDFLGMPLQVDIEEPGDVRSVSRYSFSYVRCLQD